MARKLRVQYPGALYHVMNRGDRGESIVRDDDDRRGFVQTLAETCTKTDWQIHAWCLMKNHFHLVVETPRANLVAGMKWFLGTYTGRFNRRHRLFGHLFSGRYKALFVDGSRNSYLRTVCDYVHLNPIRARLLNKGQPVRSFVWSSFPEYLEAPGRRPAWLRVDRLLGETGIRHDSAAGRRRFEQRLEDRRVQDEGSDWKVIRRGWCYGDDAFRRELLERMDGRLGEDHSAGERRETTEEKAERLVREGLGRVGWTEADSRRRPKSAAVKLKLATELRQKTTMTLQWIAERLHMGAWTHLNKRLYDQRKQGGRSKCCRK